MGGCRSVHSLASLTIASTSQVLNLFWEGSPRTMDCEELMAIFQDFTKGFTVENSPLTA
jgi:hypothetical protein